jgi:hypothetical protein
MGCHKVSDALEDRRELRNIPAIAFVAVIAQSDWWNERIRARKLFPSRDGSGGSQRKNTPAGASNSIRGSLFRNAMAG